MTARQKQIRWDLEAWEAYINYLSNKKRVSETLLVSAMEQRKDLLKLLLKVQTEEFDRS